MSHLAAIKEWCPRSDWPGCSRAAEEHTLEDGHDLGGFERRVSIERFARGVLGAIKGQE